MRSVLRPERDSSSDCRDSSSRLISSAYAVAEAAVASSVASGRSSGGSKRASANILRRRKSQMTSIKVLFIVGGVGKLNRGKLQQASWKS